MWTAAAMKDVKFAGDVDEVRRNRRSFNGGTYTVRGTVDCRASAKEGWRKGARQGQRQGWQGRERQGGSGQGGQRSPPKGSWKLPRALSWTVWNMRRVRQESRRTHLVVGRGRRGSGRKAKKWARRRRRSRRELATEERGRSAKRLAPERFGKRSKN